MCMHFRQQSNINLKMNQECATQGTEEFDENAILTFNLFENREQDKCQRNFYMT